MSTRCTLAVIDGDRMKGVYCHSDGYLSWTGARLLERYNQSDLAIKLIEGGDMSGVGRERPSYYNERDGEHTEPWDSTADDFDGLKELADGCGAEWVYLFGHMGWQVARFQRSGPLNFELLTKAYINASA